MKYQSIHWLQTKVKLQIDRNKKDNQRFLTMSSSQSQQQKKNRKAFSKTLKSEIKRKPHTQPINGVQYTYGLLQKRSQSSLFNNERFLIIKGHSTFGYASKLPDQTLLPFLEQSNIPKCKVQIPLEKLQFKNQKQILIVEFFEQGKKDKTRWEFTCGSKVKAIEWRQKLQGAKNQKISLNKNTAFKVILEDVKQHNEESENQKPMTNQKNPIIQSENSPNQLIRAQDQSNKKAIQLENEDRKMLKQTDFNQFTQQTVKDTYQKKPLQTIQNEIVVGSYEKFPEVNIFESLIYSSPNKQPLKLFFETQQKTYQKQFSDMKNNQNNSITPKSSHLQYQRLKRQQQTLQQQMREQQQKSAILSSVLSPLMDKTYQLQKLRKQWGYQFARGGTQYSTIQSFRIYSQIMLSKIIDQLSLQSKSRYYHPISQNTTCQRYEIDGVLFEIYLRTLRQVVSYEKRGTVISSYDAKLAVKEFHNYDYILSLTANKGRIRVPLTMVVEYKGFICVVKVIVPEGEGYDNLDSLTKELALLEAESKISNAVFQNGQAGRIVPLDSKPYQKIARVQNSLSSSLSSTTSGMSKKFDICYVQSLINYLPQDFYYFTKLDSSPNPTRSQLISPLSPVRTLRKQLIQQYDDVIFSGENMANVAQRLKIHPQMKQAIDVLVNVSKTINERVVTIVRALESLEEIVINSKQLARLMHSYGVNMRYLGLVLEMSRETWLRCIVMSEIVARCAKKFFHYSLQQCITNLQQTKLQSTQKYEVKVAISFLNKLLGSSQQTDHFWIQLSRQSQQDYRCFIDKREINLGYLIQALQSQCRIKLTNNVLDKKDQFFKSPQPLSISHFHSFTIQSKTYNLQFTQLYTTVDKHLKQATRQSFQQLSILLNLQRKSEIPSHFMMGDFYQKIILYMINWISPKDGQQLYYHYHEGEIMGKVGEMLPSKMLYEMKLSEIKWILKEKLQSQAEKIRDWMIEHIHTWLGEYHPLLSQLYDIFSRYYLSSKREQKKAITYCKSSIKNLQKLLSRDNIKLADSYYMLAEVYINYDKKSQALGSLLRAKEIMEKGEEEEEGYGMVVLRISQVMLALQMVEEAIEQGREAYRRLIERGDVEKLVQSIEVLGRCFEISSRWDDYMQFIQIFITSHHDRLPLISQNSILFQRIMKIILLPYLRSLATISQISSQLITIIQSFSSLSNTTQSTYTNSLSYLNQLIVGLNNNNNIRFPLSFIAILEDQIEVVLEEIDAVGLMARWKGFETYIHNKNFAQKINSLNNINPKLFQFLSQLQTLTIILGQSWFIGALNYF